MKIRGYMVLFVAWAALVGCNKEGETDATVADGNSLDAALVDSESHDVADPDHPIVDAPVPDQAVPDLAQPDEMVPDQMQPDEMVPDLAQPDEMVPDQMQPDAMVPDLAQPDEMVPDQMQPDIDPTTIDRTKMVCPGGTDLLSVAPLEDSVYDSISPLGATNPSGHTFPTYHTYMMLSNLSNEVTVYAAVDATISFVSFGNGGSSVTMHLYVCEDVYIYHDHMTTVSETISSQLSQDTLCQWSSIPPGMEPYCVSINVQAGDVIGTIGGPNADGSAALDFGMRDKRTELGTFVNQTASYGSDQEYVACPYDYYPDGVVKTHFINKLSVQRTDLPLCNTIYFDLPNTAQGLWYAEGDVDYRESNGMALVRSSVDAGWGVLSMAQPPAGPEAYYFEFATSGQKRTEFSNVQADAHIYCYDSLRTIPSPVNGSPISGYLFLQMTDDATVQIQRENSGSCPSNPDTLTLDNPVTFVRE